MSQRESACKLFDNFLYSVIDFTANINDNVVFCLLEAVIIYYFYLFIYIIYKLFSTPFILDSRIYTGWL